MGEEEIGVVQIGWREGRVIQMGGERTGEVRS